MKLKLLLIICALFISYFTKAQTFNGTGGAIPDSGAIQPSFPINVSGIGVINNSLGVTSVCININHTWDADLEIYLIAPDGTSVPLSIQNGGSGDNYNSTCFSATAATLISNGVAPFNGAYIPDGYMSAVNNGQNADGAWNLYIKDIAPGNIGNLISWSISFGTNLPPPPPACNGNLPPGNTCNEATPVCSFNGFCSATSSSYTADSWPELDNAFCGTVQNNAFVKFIATAAVMDFNIWVISSTNHDGIQVLFYDGGCGTGAVTEYGCYSPISPGASPTGVTAAGLIPGNVYYLMIDGYAGDKCNYVIQPYPATPLFQVSPKDTSICEESSVQLTATGGNGNFTWTGAGLNTNNGSVVTASPTTNTIYTVSSVDNGGMCPVTKTITVDVLSLPVAPVVTDTVTYCRGAIASPLPATGNNLLWYNTPSGGQSSQQAIVPSTANAGIISYYVSQTIGCESPRIPITVVVNERPGLGADKQKTVCFGNTANLVNEFFTANLDTVWTFNNIHIAPPYAANASGVYQLEVKDNNGCTDTGSVRFTIKPPVHVFAGNDTIAVKGMPHQLHSTASSSYSWSPANVLNDPGIQNPQAVLTHDQEFVVQVTDNTGCKGSDTILVKIIQGITYYIPNAFTPNGDGLNDVFRAIPVGIAHTEYFRVLNRFGKIIFETSDPFNKGWDGTYMGYKQPSGTYVWFIKGKDINGKKVELKGTVVLIQ